MAQSSSDFKGADELISVFDKMFGAGERTVALWETVSNRVSATFEKISTGAGSAVKAVEQSSFAAYQLNTAISNINKTIAGTVTINDDFAQSVKNVTEAFEDGSDAVSKTSSNFIKSLQNTQDLKDANSELLAELKDLQNVCIGNAVQFEKNSDQVKELKGELIELSKTMDKNEGDFSNLEAESKKSGDISTDAAKKMESALVEYDDIKQFVIDIANTVIDMANEFSNSLSIIAKSTGAVGTELDNLGNSMLNVFSQGSALQEEVAGVIGALNSSLQLEGAELERVASLFMSFSKVTGEDGVSAVENISKVMKVWNIEAKDTEGLLDVLLTASQGTGASVGSLSDLMKENASALQQLGFSVNDSIALFAMFESQGVNSSTIMEGFNYAIAGFEANGINSSVAMQDIIRNISSLSSESEASELAVRTFGKSVGPDLASALRNGALEEWTAKLNMANGKLSETSKAAATLEDKWTNATNSVSAAFSKALSPTVVSVSSALAGVVQWFGDLMNKGPIITAIITGIGVVLVTTGVAFASIVAAIATAQVIVPILTGQVAVFGTTLNIALGPIGWISLAIGVLAGIVVGVSAAISDANEEFNSLTAKSKQHYTDMTDLEEKYNHAVESKGENSQEAENLAKKLETARAVYETNKMTMEDLISQNDNVINNNRKLVDSYYENIEKINSEKQSVNNLIAELETLSSSTNTLSSETNLSAAEQEQMLAITDKLNKQFPDLALSYDKTTGSLNASIASIRKMAEEQANQQKIEAQRVGFADAITEQILLEEQLKVVKEQVAAAEENKHGLGWFGDSKQSHEDLKILEEELARIQAAYDENNKVISETTAAWKEAEKAELEAAKVPVEYEDAIVSSMISIEDEVEALITKYDELKASALDSIQGQYDLWEEAKPVVAMDAETISAAIKSQQEYWDNYGTNIEKIRNMEIPGMDELLGSIADGSEESAAVIAGMATANEDELKAIVAEHNTLQGTQENLSGKFADLNPEYIKTFNDLKDTTSKSISDLNMADEAKTAATETMMAYIDAIRDHEDLAATAAEGVRRRSEGGLSGNSTETGETSNSETGQVVTVVDGNAYGTTNSSEVFIAGEEGPELIVGRKGSTVFPAYETDRIISAVNTESDVISGIFNSAVVLSSVIHNMQKSLSAGLEETGGINMPERNHVPVSTEDSEMQDTFGRENVNTLKSVEEKKITIDINGSGEIEVAGMDEETVWNIVSPKLKDAFMGIVNAEIFEEGDMAYGF
ncbi:MAG: phage tail tape measure protein [Eubacterium sp.]|jgi:TP901 family phage tail tape measure protein|nr:phage tail tape measure protein [Eubacterium sp.]